MAQVNFLFYFILMALTIIVLVLLFPNFSNLLLQVFSCPLISQQVESVNIDAKLKANVKEEIKISSCFKWIQAPCQVKYSLPEDVKLNGIEKGETYTICGLVKESIFSKNFILKCFNFDVKWDSKGTTLPGTYNVIVGGREVVFEKECNRGDSFNVCYATC